MNQSLILTNCLVPNWYFLCLHVNWNLSAFGCSYFCVCFSHMRENLRGLIKKCKTQNPCLKSNSVAGIWTSLWLHCFSWSESSAHETHPTFWGCFVFTIFFSYLSLFFSSFSFSMTWCKINIIIESDDVSTHPTSVCVSQSTWDRK